MKPNNINSYWVSTLDDKTIEIMLGVYGDDVDKLLRREIRKRKLKKIQRSGKFPGGTEHITNTLVCSKMKRKLEKLIKKY